MMFFLKTLIITALFSLSASAAPIQQNDYIENLLEKLSNLHAGSGFEAPVRQFLKIEWKPLTENLQTDKLGNLLGTAIKNNNGPRILLMAHMDEVGLIVRDISPEGYIYFDMLGDILDIVIPGQRWIIMTAKGPIVAYSGVESVHITGDQPAGATPKVAIKKMFLDIGVKNREEALNLGIRPGLPITPASSFSKIGNGQRYLAKALDDRVGLVVITDILKKLKEKNHNVNTVLVAATTQEEVGMRGASIVYENLKPDLIINIEVGMAKDFPLLMTEGAESGPKLGAGPTLFVYDYSMIPNQKLLESFIAFAKDKKIDFQYEFAGNYMQDASVVQTGSGIPAINIGIPSRYGHSHLGVIDRRDLDSTVRLVAEFIQSLSSEKYKDIQAIDGK